MPSAMKIAIVDDEKDMRQSISQWLALSGYDTEAFPSAEEALKVLGADYPGIVVTDIKMPGMDGMQFLKKLMGNDSSLPVIMITGHGDVPMAVEAMRVGAYDFLEKPFNPDRMNELAKKATQARRMTLDSRALRRELSEGGQLMKKLIGSSPVMERLKEDILDLGQADGHVLIEGETGTGKTLVAHALHAVGSRAGKKFVLVSCAGFEEEAIIKRLFGPMQPEDSQLPAVEEARGGTLVLEDIEALSDAAQAKLLNFINDEGTPPETRIVAICNMQEQDRTCEDALRVDLFYRLAALRIIVPPLRQRGEDILTLFTRFGECGRLWVRAAAGDRSGGRTAVAGTLARQRAATQQRRRTRRAAGTPGQWYDCLSADVRPSGYATGHDHRGQAAERICRGVRADADRQHHAPTQRWHCRRDGRAVPAAPYPERKNGQIRPATVGLSWII